MQKQTIIWTAVVLIGLGVLTYFIIRNSKPDPNDPRTVFAQCLGEKGAKFYGAFWCPHCQNQKKIFGRSAKALPYIECSTANKEMNQVCKDAGITGYPTWVFADGSRLNGEVPFTALAEKTGCAVPPTK